MRWTAGKSRGPIGIDLGSRSIKAVQLSTGKTPAVTAAMSIPRVKEGAPIDREEAHRLAEILYRQGFEGRDVVLAAPNEALIVGTLALPPKQSGAPVDQIARMELARLHKQDPAGFELAHWELPAAAAAPGAKGAAATSVMAAACPHRAAEELLDVLEGADLDVVGLDVQWLALARACKPMFVPAQGAAPESGAEMAAMVDLGWRAARVIVLRGGLVVFERLLTEGGLCKLSETLKTQLQLNDDAVDFLLRDVGCAEPKAGDRRSDPARADTDRRDTLEDEFKEPRRVIAAHFALLREELQISLSYAMQQFRGDGTARLALTGGGGAIPGLAAQLAESLALTVEPADLHRLVQCPRGLDRLASSTVLTTALGLAMYQV